MKCKSVGLKHPRLPSVNQLIAQMHAVQRRHQELWTPPKPAESEIIVGPIALNVAEPIAMKDGEQVPLPVTEFRLLRYLLANAGMAVPLRVILRQVRGYDDS
jgi:DNA-binding response OmpR family regulator